MGKIVKAIVTVAVVVAIAYFAPQLAPFLVGALGVSTAVATALVTFGLTAIATIGLKALGLTPSAGLPSSRQAAPGLFRQSISSSFIAYGRRRLGGLLVFVHESQVSGDYFRYFVIACTGHRCAGNPSFMLNDEVVTVNGSGMVTTGPYANAAWLWFQRGLDSETANATFVSETSGKWSAAHKGNNVSAIFAKFKMTDDVVSAGMPQMSVIVDGKDDIHDYRDGSDDNYTANAALVFYDWMKLDREEGGFGAYDDEIPDASWIAAQANVCDEEVALAAGGTEPRYELSGVIATGSTPSQIRDILTLNCAGSFSYSGGKLIMRPGYYVPSTHQLLESNLAGPIQVSSFDSGDQTANQVLGTFVDPGQNYSGSSFPAQIAAGDADPRQVDLDLSFVTSSTRAQRIARIMLNRALAEKTVQWTSNIEDLDVNALDTVTMDADRYGLSNYAWSVRNWALTAEYNITLSLKEESSEIYDWSTSDEQSLAALNVLTPPTVITSDALTRQLIGTSYTSGLTGNTTSDDEGSSSGADIAIPTHSRIYNDRTVSLTGDTISGLEYGKLHYIFYDDRARAGGAVTFGALAFDDADIADAFQSSAFPYRHPCGSIITDTDGGGGTTGGGVGPPGGGVGDLP